MKIAQWKLVVQALAGLTGICCAGSVEAGEIRLAQTRPPGGVERAPIPSLSPVPPSAPMPREIQEPRMPEPMNAPAESAVPDASPSAPTSEPEIEEPSYPPAKDAEPTKSDEKKSEK